MKFFANKHRILGALALSVAVSACSGMAAQYNNYLQDQIITYGTWELDVESELTQAGVSGLVEAEGCGEVEVMADEQPENSTQIVMTTETHCDRFPVAGALVRIVVDDVVVTRRTDAQGRYSVDSGSDLARLTGAGNSGMVEASFRGRTAQSRLTFGALDEVAALALLEEMQEPSVQHLQLFVAEWAGTDAADLALERFGDVACRAFRADWNDMMAGGDVEEMSAISDTYDDEWQETFCGPCSAECRMLEVLPDLSSEVGAIR